jgi:Zn-dependent M28 family amino/carboxypeptidase
VNSAVHIASLNKAFDGLHHYKLYHSLLTDGVHINVNIVGHWYSKIYFAVRWNSKLSAPFAAGKPNGGAAGEPFVAGNIQYFIIHSNFKGQTVKFRRCF